MKRLVSKFILICFALTSLVPQTIGAQENYQMVTFNIRMDSIKSNQMDVSDVEHTFKYSDSYFYSDNTKYNDELALLSLGLEMSSITAVTALDRNDQTLDSTIRAANLITAFDAMGFSDYKLYKYDVPLTDDSDTAACGFATKTINNGTSNDTLVAVAIRGEGYGAEWASDFRIGDTGDATGFANAANYVLNNLEDYLQDVEVTGNLKLWVVGYSRGAAVADLMVHYINEDTAAVSDTLQSSNIYAYAFATPNAAVNASNNADNNIINIVSQNDFIPEFPFSEWGFSRYGQTMELPAADTDAVMEKYKEYTDSEPILTTNYTARSVAKSILIGLYPSRSDYTSYLEANLVEALKSQGSNSSELPTVAILEGMGFGQSSSNPYLSGIMGAMGLQFAYAHISPYYLAWIESGEAKSAFEQANAEEDGDTKYTQTLKIKKKKITVSVKTNNKNKSTKKRTIGKKKLNSFVKGVKTTLTFKKVSGNKKIKITPKGKIIIKKGIKCAKIYKVKVRAIAAESSRYNKASKTFTVKIKVKAKK